MALVLENDMYNLFELSPSVIFSIFKIMSGSVKYVTASSTNISQLCYPENSTENPPSGFKHPILQDLSAIFSNYFFPTIGTFALVSNALIIYSAKRGKRMTASQFYMTMIAVIDITFTFVADLGIGLEHIFKQNIHCFVYRSNFSDNLNVFLTVVVVGNLIGGDMGRGRG